MALFPYLEHYSTGFSKECLSRYTAASCSRKSMRLFLLLFALHLPLVIGKIGVGGLVSLMLATVEPRRGAALICRSTPYHLRSAEKK